MDINKGTTDYTLKHNSKQTIHTQTNMHRLENIQKQRHTGVYTKTYKHTIHTQTCIHLKTYKNKGTTEYTLGAACNPPHSQDCGFTRVSAFPWLQ